MTGSRQLSRERALSGGSPERIQPVLQPALQAAKNRKSGALSSRKGSVSRRRQQHGIFALLGLLDDVDRRTTECYKTSQSQVLGCCAVAPPDREPPVLGPDGTFPLVPGWSSPADAGLEVLEKRSVGMIDASFSSEVLGKPGQGQGPVIAPLAPLALVPLAPLSPLTPLAPALLPEEKPVQPATGQGRWRQATVDLSWGEPDPPEEPRPRVPVGSWVAQPPKAPQTGPVPTPATTKVEATANRGKRPSLLEGRTATSDSVGEANANRGKRPSLLESRAATSESLGEGPLFAEEAPARRPLTKNQGMKGKLAKYLGSKGKGSRHHQPLDDLTRHLIGCHERDKLFPQTQTNQLMEPSLPEGDGNEICLKGTISEVCGVLRVRTDQGSDVFLTYRASTARWLVVHSTAKDVPLGSTGDYPDSTAAMLQMEELLLERPSWQAVLGEPAVAEALMVAELRMGTIIDKQLQGASAPKQLVVLCGPPGSGKTTAALARPELNYKTSVRIVQDEVIRDCTEQLFKKLVEGRPNARVDPFEKEAFLIESLHLHTRFVDLATTVLWKGERNVLREALERGVGVVMETMGASLNNVRPAVEAAVEKGYKVTALFCQVPGAELRRRCERRIEQELATGTMLGSRRFDAFLDHLAEAAAEVWPDLSALVGEARMVRYDEKDPLASRGDVILRGQTSERCGVVQVRTTDSNEVHLTYRADTARWLVVRSTADDVPLGSTASYPDSTAALVGRTEVRLRRPTWTPVLSEVEIQEAAARVKQKLHVMVDGLVVGKSAPKQLTLLFGPPDCGKTTLAQEMPELHYSRSVLLAQDDVVCECCIGLFQKLVLGRPRARTDPFEKEAFLIESLRLHENFADIGTQAIWKGRDNALTKALARGVGVIAESAASSLEGFKPMAAAARESGYDVIGIFPAAPGGELRRRCEERFDRELEAGRMLGGRHFDAYMDLYADMATKAWPELGPLCDEMERVRGCAGPVEAAVAARVAKAVNAPPPPEVRPVPPPSPDLKEESGPLSPRELSVVLGIVGRERDLDFDMVLTDLEEAEERVYGEAFALFSDGAVALDSAHIRQFLVENSCLTAEELSTVLYQTTPDMKLSLVKFIRLLRERACMDEPAMRLFMDTTPNGHTISLEACRRNLLGLAVSERRGLPGARRMEKERWERVLDTVTTGASEGVGLQQWLTFWRKTARIMRLVHWAKL